MFYILITIVINVNIYTMINVVYPFFKKSKEKLYKESIKNLIKEIKFRIMIKLCNVLISFTDNIIIENFINVVAIQDYIKIIY